MFNLFTKKPPTAQDLGYYDQAIESHACEAMAIFCEFDDKHKRLFNELMKNLQPFFNDKETCDQIVLGDFLIVKNGANLTIHNLPNYD